MTIIAATARQLRQDLEILLSSWLGEYTLGNGVKTPAVSVRADSESIAAGTTVSGVELVINRHSAPDPVRQYRKEQVNETWEVWLLEWDGKTSLNEAAAAVISWYPGTTAQIITLPEGWGPKRQIKLDLLQPPFYDLKWLDVDGGDFHDGIAFVQAAAVLDGGNFFDGSTLNTYAGSGDGGVFT